MAQHGFRSSYNWLKMHRYTDLSENIKDHGQQAIRSQLASPSDHCVQLDEIPVDQPVAVVFSNEHRGVAPEWDRN